MGALSYNDLTGMLESSAALVLQNIEKLNQLDTLIGDGDHGTTMLKIMGSVRRTIESKNCQDLEKLMDNIGWNVMSQDGGSAGMLMGCFFKGMAMGYKADDSNAIVLSNMLTEGTVFLEKNSGASLGDKTMLDSLIPAVSTYSESIKGGADIVHAFRLSVDAAYQGVDNTKDMIPVRGRAKNLGKKALGVCDPGATSVALIFQGFYDYWKSRGE